MKVLKKFFEIFRICISFILTLCLSIIILFVCLILNLKGFTNKNNVNKIINDIDISEGIILIENGTIWHNLNILATKYNLENDDVTSLVNSSSIKSLVSGYVYNLFDSVINEKEIEVFSEEELVLAFDGAIDEYNSESSNKISNHTKASILDFASNEYSLVNSYLSSEDRKIEAEKGLPIEKIRKYYKLFTSENLIGYLVIAALFIVILLALLRWSYYKWIFYLGCSLFLSSTCVAGFKIILDNYYSKLVINSSFMKSVTSSMVNNVGNNIGITAVILMVLSIFVLTFHKHFKHSFKIKYFVANTETEKMS